VRVRSLVILVAIAAVCLFPAAALAEFGFEPGGTGFAISSEDEDATPTTQAGAHPYRFTADIRFSTAGGGSDGDLRDLTVALPPGFLVNPGVVSDCTTVRFATPRNSPNEDSESGEDCPNAAQVGVIGATVAGETRNFGLFSLTPAPGHLAAFGTSPFGVPLIFTLDQREHDYGLDLRLHGVPQRFDLHGLKLELWGTPWEPVHSEQRGDCLNEQSGASWGKCPVLDVIEMPKDQIKSYLTMPTTPCGSALPFSAQAVSWQSKTSSAAATTPALTACSKALATIKAQLMTEAAAARTGLALDVFVNDGGGMTNPNGIARPPIKTVRLSLPEGLTINPSLAAGLTTCSPAQFGGETASSAEGAGCPNGSKIGTLSVEGAFALEETIRGSVYLAKPYDNPFGSLLAIYLVARSERRGLILKSVGRLDPDERSGRLTVLLDELPRFLYTHLSVTLREGQRSTLVSPPFCGSHLSSLEFNSYVTPTSFSRQTSAFLITRGDGVPCPGGGAQPFSPGLLAGSLSPTPAAYSPFYLRMTRTDAEQEITSYSATLPPGVLARLAGIPDCPDAAIAAARAGSAAAELAAPSCPAASRIGTTLAGYGVGGVLAWARGDLYLAGPYQGAPLSVVAVNPALIGPFDLGVVTVRSAIRIDPRTAQVQIDSAGSDPIPHILKGLPLHLRDIRVSVDRPDFTTTPTSCDPMQVASRLTGAGADLFSAADDASAVSVQRYQLLGCGRLGFRPRFRIRLAGGTPRFPALRAELKTAPGQANLGAVSVTMPATQFLAQSHLGEVCTRVQFDRDACPPDSVYGTARVFTPLLDQPLEGPVYLRSANPLPDLVFVLEGRGGIRIDVAGDIDTVHGGLRAKFAGLPDAPISRFVLSMAGAEKGLLESAGGACRTRQFAHARLIAQSNLGEALTPRVRQKCRKTRKKSRTGQKGRR
jgi:hypothetical protein